MTCSTKEDNRSKNPELAAFVDDMRSTFNAKLVYLKIGDQEWGDAGDESGIVVPCTAIGINNLPPWSERRKKYWTK